MQELRIVERRTPGRRPGERGRLRACHGAARARLRGDEPARRRRPQRSAPDAATSARTAYDLYTRASALDEDAATYDEAEALYLQALRFDPSLAIAYTNLGNVRFRRGDEEGALALYRKALHVDPFQPEAHYNIGYVALEHGDARTAVTHFEKALEADTRFADAHFNLAMALERVQTSPARRSTGSATWPSSPPGRGRRSRASTSRDAPHAPHDVAVESRQRGQRPFGRREMRPSASKRPRIRSTSCVSSGQLSRMSSTVR